MIQHLQIEKTVDTPIIDFDPVKGEILIEGKSFPNDVTQFYYPLINWLKEYSLAPANKTVVNLKLDYFNTASSKLLLEIFNLFESIYKAGNDVEMNWYYPDDDDDMRETGEEYSEIVKVPFNKIGYSVMFD